MNKRERASVVLPLLLLKHKVVAEIWVKKMMTQSALEVAVIRSQEHWWGHSTERSIYSQWVKHCVERTPLLNRKGSWYQLENSNKHSPKITPTLGTGMLETDSIVPNYLNWFTRSWFAQTIFAYWHTGNGIIYDSLPELCTGQSGLHSWIQHKLHAGNYTHRNSF